MKKNESIRIKAWHILIVIIFFTIFMYMLGRQNLSRAPLNGYEDSLIELNESSFCDSITPRKCFVLFYVEDSKPCNTMRSNLNKLSNDSNGKIGFYKLNLNKYPEYDLKYNISGVPNIFIFDEGKETARIMGVVPEKNLRIILNKTINQ